MELRDLKTFVTVARLRSFHRASTVLHTAQSTISARIAVLESDLQTRLFERLGRGIVLTEPGQRLLDYAVRMLELEDEARAWVCGESESRGALTIRIPESLCAYRMGEVIRRFRERFPHVSLSFTACASEGLDRDLRGGLTDLAFLMADSVRGGDLIVEALAVESLALVSSPNHRLAGQKEVRATDLRGETLVLSKADCSYRALFEAMLEEAGVQTGAGLEFSSAAALRGAVMSGVGLTILPVFALRGEISRGGLVVLPWNGPPLETAVLMLRHREKWLSPPLAGFMDLVRQELGSSVDLPTQASVPGMNRGSGKKCC
jgi:DNA-binding transcriptional LysR family regulator